MTHNDYEKFKSAWVNANAISANSKQLNDSLISYAFEILYEYPIEKILGALFIHAKKQKFAPSPADVVDILSAQLPRHLGPEEAWAIALRSFDEALPVVLTQQILEAKALVQDIWDSGDAIATRMAFRETYNRILLTASDPKWFLTQGDDKSLTADVVQKAVDMGRLPPGSAEQYRLEAPVMTTQKLIEQAHQRTGKVSALAKLGIIKAILADEVDDNGVAAREQDRQQFECTRKAVLDNADPTGEIRKNLVRRQQSELH